MKVEFSLQIFEKSTNSIFNEKI